MLTHLINDKTKLNLFRLFTIEMTPTTFELIVEQNKTDQFYYQMQDDREKTPNIFIKSLTEII